MTMGFEFDPSELADLLHRNPCTADYSREDWYRVGMAVKSAGLGFEVWDAWSSTADPRYNQRSCEDTWNSFSGDGVTHRTAFQILKEHGVDISRKRNEEQPRKTARGKNPQAGGGEFGLVRRKKVRPLSFDNIKPPVSAESDGNTTPRGRLVAAANGNLKNNPNAQDRVSAYLAAHIGIAPDVAAGLYGFGFLTSKTIADYPALARVAEPYSHGDWLIMPTEGKPDYFVARAIPNGDYEQWAAWGNAEYKSSPNGCKAKNPKGNRPALTNPGALNGGPVFVVEGIQDEVAIRERGYNATATLGTDYTRRAVEALEGYEGGVIVMFDSDEAGHEASKKLATALGGTCLAFDWGGIPYKDAGEWNGADPHGLTAALEHASRAVPKREGGEQASKRGREDWKRCKAIIPNLEAWLHENLPAEALSFNTATQEVTLTARLPEERPGKDVPRAFDWDNDLSRLDGSMQRDFNKNIAESNIRKAIKNVAHEHAYDPVVEAINTLPAVTYNADGSTTFTETSGETWTQPPLYTEEDLKALGEVEPDGEGGFYIRFNGDSTAREKSFHLPRVAGFVLWHVLKADLTPLTFYSEYIHLSGVIARGLHHGCNYPFALAITGRQGIGKDAYIGATSIDPGKFLHTGDFQNMLSDPMNETAEAAGNLVLSYEEFTASNGKGNVNRLKSFITKQTDTINVKFEKVRTIPRSYVIATSSNDRDLLNDPTGNRRFMVVQCHGCKNLGLGYGYRKLVRLVRGSLAEMLHEWNRYGGEPFEERFNVPGFILAAMETQAKFYSIVDERRELITDWLDQTDKYTVCIEMAAVESKAWTREEWERVKDKEARRVGNIIDDHFGYKRDPNRSELKGYGKRTTWTRKPEYRV